MTGPGLPAGMRPLSRIGEGQWRTRDGRWTFRHEPYWPYSWFVYEGENDEPENIGTHLDTLRSAIDFAVQIELDDAPESD